MVLWWYFHSLFPAAIFSLTSWDGLQTLLDSLVPGTAFMVELNQVTFFLPALQNLDHKCQSLYQLWSGRVGRSHPTGPRFRGHEAFHHCSSISKSAGKLPCASIFFNSTKFKNMEVSLLVNVRYSLHKWAQNNLCVILKEIDLKKKIIKIKHLKQNIYKYAHRIVKTFNPMWTFYWCR